MMRASNCPTKLYVNMNVEIDDKRKTLTIFDDVLKASLGHLNHESLETENIVEQLLLQESISIVCNDRNVITKMQNLS